MKRLYLFLQGNNDQGRTWFLSAYGIASQNGRPFVVWDSAKFPMKCPGPAAHSEGGIHYSAGCTCWHGHGPRGHGDARQQIFRRPARWRPAGSYPTSGLVGN